VRTWRILLEYSRDNARAAHQIKGQNWTMTLLNGFRVLQLGDGLAAAVCGRLFADSGAEIDCLGAESTTPLAIHLNHGKRMVSKMDAGVADLIVVEGAPADLRAAGWDAAALHERNRDATVVLIAPFGQTGPQADWPASDLSLFCASGIARLLTGQVDDLNEAPMRPAGEQAAFIGGLAAACAGMHAALLRGGGAMIDVSIHEALATLAMTELARAGLGRPGWSRRRMGDGNGATVTILPARDGYVAISPREDRQWAAWLGVMGSPAWGREARFARKPDRVKNWNALHALMSRWSRAHDKQWIADAAQAAHVPGFPLRAPGESLESAQLNGRGFFRPLTVNGVTLKAPGSPFAAPLTPPGAARPASAASMTATLPLDGVRVLDFSWVIAGPTATRYLAAMGADIIKVEAPGRGDPGRASELHSVLGQGKRAIVLNLKSSDGARVARSLVARCNIVIESFGSGVMERFGLGAAALQAQNPGLIYISASGLGRSGPESNAVAYGTLLQCYAGFAGLNTHDGNAPRVGMAWLDPMCGLQLGFIAAAALWQRRVSGQGCRVDFSMIEALLWTMAEPLLAAQLGTSVRTPLGIYATSGDDNWIGISADNAAQWRSLCALVPGLAARHGDWDKVLRAWLRGQSAADAARRLIDAGIPASLVATFGDLVASDHLRARNFWEDALPGLPWQASFGRKTGPAPELGADTEAVLGDVLGLGSDEIEVLRSGGAFG
jgi:crotonobetainyl-CoA:carnitine CoA-transferase CaiB-like acyl-CoA transferase